MWKSAVSGISQKAKVETLRFLLETERSNLKAEKKKKDRKLRGTGKCYESEEAKGKWRK